MKQYVFWFFFIKHINQEDDTIFILICFDKTSDQMVHLLITKRRHILSWILFIHTFFYFCMCTCLNQCHCNILIIWLDFCLQTVNRGRAWRTNRNSSLSCFSSPRHISGHKIYKGWKTLLQVNPVLFIDFKEKITQFKSLICLKALRGANLFDPKLAPHKSFLSLSNF